MNHLIPSLGAAALALAISTPAFAFDTGGATGLSELSGAAAFAVNDEIDRKGRNRGGRSRPRVPGGSGCDDPGDILEHPECAG